MLLKHFPPRCPGAASLAAALLLSMIAFSSLVRPAAMADAADVFEQGEYTFVPGETVARPNVLLSLDPATDRVVFENGAVLDTDVAFDLDNLRDQWALWHRETGADPGQLGGYGLEPLAGLTIGNNYDKIVLEKDARIVNRDELGDGLLTLGDADLDIGPGANVYGRWAAVSFGNFEAPEDDAFFKGDVTNQGQIGILAGDDVDEESLSRFGILFYEGVEGSVVNEAAGVIRGVHSGILINYKERDDDLVPLPEPDPDLDPGEIEYVPGKAFRLDNKGIILAEFYGVYDGGGLEDVDIVNHETGHIEGGIAGIYLLRGGEVVNHGEIKGETTGVYVDSGTGEIVHWGALTATDDEFGDAIRFGGAAEGGAVTLHSSVDGRIRHYGDTEDAILTLTGQGGGDSLFVGGIGFGDGVLVQQGGAWSYGDIAAGALQIDGGEMLLDSEVSVLRDIDIDSGARLTVSGGTVSSKNFISRGTLNFEDGEILVDGGVFDYRGPAGSLRSLRIAGAEDGHNPHLRLVDGAGIEGVGAFDIGGNQKGTLTLEGDAAVSFQSRLAVHNRGLLAGSGTVGGQTEVRDGGTIRPGHPDDPTGTLSIEGDLELETGAVVDIGVKAGDHNNAAVEVSGQAAINGASVKVTDFSNREIRDGTEYTFLTTGIPLAEEDRFNPDVISFSRIYAFDLLYGTNAVSLRADRQENFSDPLYATTKNRQKIARTLEAGREEGNLVWLGAWMDWRLESALDAENPEIIHQALDQLGPEPYQAASRMAADNAGQMTRRILQGARTSRLQIGTEQAQGGRQAMTGALGTALALVADDPAALDRFSRAGSPGGLGETVGPGIMRVGSASNADGPVGPRRIMPDERGESIQDSGLRVFYGGYRRIGDVDAGPARMGHDYKVRGGYLGFERPRNGVIAGIGLSYANSEVEFDDDGGNLNMHSYRLGPHATIDRGSLEVDVAVSAGWHPSRQKRNMPHINRESVVRFNTWDGSLYTGARYELFLRDRWRLVPSAALQYSHQYRASFKERRAEDARLKVDSDSHDVLRSMMGLQFSREFRGSRFVFVPEVFGGWTYDLLDPDMTMSAKFLDAPGSSLRLDAEAPGREALSYGGALTMLFGEYNVAFAAYEKEATDDGDNYTFSAGVKWNF